MITHQLLLKAECQYWARFLDGIAFRDDLPESVRVVFAVYGTERICSCAILLDALNTGDKHTWYHTLAEKQASGRKNTLTYNLFTDWYRHNRN